MDDSEQDIFVDVKSKLKISSFLMDLSDLSASTASRQLTISGDRGSKLNIQIYNSSGAFYNFTTRTFAQGFKSVNNLNVTLSGGSYNTTIIFPAESGGKTYYILLFSTPELDTEFSKASGATGKYILSKSITQLANTVLTLAPTNAGSGMKTMPSSTLTASTQTAGSTDIDIDWDIENVDTDANGFGLRLIRQPVEKDWYFQTTETVDGAITSATEVKVDDLTDITEGMVITAVSSGSLTSASITAIDTNEKTLTLSAAQTFADGITLTLQARGSSQIQSAIGVNLSIGTITATETELIKTVRTDVGSTTVNLNGTYGIAGGGHVKIKGANVNNATANTVQSVSASEGAGSMVMSLDQSGISAGTKLTFEGCTCLLYTSDAADE